MSSNRAVFITGASGAGKSTLARALRKEGVTVIDRVIKEADENPCREIQIKCPPTIDECLWPLNTTNYPTRSWQKRKKGREKNVY